MSSHARSRVGSALCRGPCWCSRSPPRTRSEGRSHAERRASCRGGAELRPSVLSLEVGVIDNLLIDTLESSLALPLESSETRTELAGRLALALYWADDDRRRTAAESVLDSAAESEGAGERARALLFRLGSNSSPDDLPGRRRKLDLLDKERGSLPSSLAPVVRVYRVATFLEANALAEMDMEIHLLEGELRASGVPYCAWYPRDVPATQALYRGELYRALSLAQEYVTIGQQFEDSNVANSFAAQWGEVQWLRGNAAAAMAPVETSLINSPHSLNGDASLSCSLCWWDDAPRHSRALTRCCPQTLRS